MVSGDPQAAGADIVCTVSFNLLTAIKLQSHMGSRWQVSLFGGGGGGGGVPTVNIYFLSFLAQSWNVP